MLLLKMWDKIVRFMILVMIFVTTICIPVSFYYMVYYLYFFDFFRFLAFSIFMIISVAINIIFGRA